MAVCVGSVPVKAERVGQGEAGRVCEREQRMRESEKHEYAEK